VSHETIFTKIYNSNAFRGKVSLSGPGSDPDQTTILIEQLPRLLRKFEISTLLDIPCGDCRWIRSIDLGNTAYTGADIVQELIQRNAGTFSGKRMRFVRLDLLTDPLPKVDAILCRDCLVHFSLRDSLKALRNICKSGSTFLLTTTFVSRTENADILTGQWRPLNLQAPPFHFPAPEAAINEMCTEGNGACADKSLALWRIGEIRKCI